MIKKFFSILLCCLVFATVASAFESNSGPNCRKSSTHCYDGKVTCGDRDPATCANGNTPYCNDDEPSCRYTPACSDGSALSCGNKNDKTHCGGINAHPVCQYHDQDKVNSSFRVSCDNKKKPQPHETFTCVKK